jgi:hypothetical protein
VPNVIYFGSKSSKGVQKLPQARSLR